MNNCFIFNKDQYNCLKDLSSLLAFWNSALFNSYSPNISSLWTLLIFLFKDFSFDCGSSSFLGGFAGGLVSIKPAIKVSNCLVPFKKKNTITPTKLVKQKSNAYDPKFLFWPFLEKTKLAHLNTLIFEFVFVL